MAVSDKQFTLDDSRLLLCQQSLSTFETKRFKYASHGGSMYNSFSLSLHTPFSLPPPNLNQSTSPPLTLFILLSLHSSHMSRFSLLSFSFLLLSLLSSSLVPLSSYSIVPLSLGIYRSLSVCARSLVSVI